MIAHLNISVSDHGYVVLCGTVEEDGQIKPVFETIRDGPLLEALIAWLPGIPLGADYAVGERYEK